jgi:hypothetical protein
MTYIAVLGLLLAIATNSRAGLDDAACADVEKMIAETSTSKLRTWSALHESFKRFGRCDDGYIAEGYSEAVVVMLARRWSQLRDLSRIAASDAAFRAFVLRHIDATTDEQDLHEVLDNTTMRCAKSYRPLCTDIERQARAALREVVR